jgi:hypothetical protein
MSIALQVTMDHVNIYLSFIAETSLTVKLHPRSSWRTDCITLRSVNLDITMKLVLLRKNFGSLCLVAVKLTSRHLYTIIKQIIMIVFVLVMGLISK